MREIESKEKKVTRENEKIFLREGAFGCARVHIYLQIKIFKIKAFLYMGYEGT